MLDFISTISSSIAIVQRLREIAKNIEEAEFKSLLADLSNEMADLKLEAVALKEQIAQLQEENALLKKTIPPTDEKPVGRESGCYRFKDDDGLYCPGCWDSKRLKCSTTQVTDDLRLCSVCKAPIGAN